jgi:hypothetical protein
MKGAMYISGKVGVAFGCVENSARFEWRNNLERTLRCRQILAIEKTKFTPRAYRETLTNPVQKWRPFDLFHLRS